MTKEKLSEEEIGSVAEAYFQSKGWETYPEVVLENFAGRPDIIGTKASLVMVAECKVSFTYPVLEQLTRWRHDLQYKAKYYDTDKQGIPHLLWAVVGGGSVSDLKAQIMADHGIGLIRVKRQYKLSERMMENLNYKEGKFDSYGNGSLNGYAWHVNEYIHPKIQVGSRQTAHLIREQLNEDMRCANAGASGREGGFMTPFKRTINKAKEVLSDGEVWHIQHIVEKINEDHGGHHYASDAGARNSIAKFLVEFDIAEQVTSYSMNFRIKEKQLTGFKDRNGTDIQVGMVIQRVD